MCSLRCLYIHIAAASLILAAITTTTSYAQAPRFGVKTILPLPDVKDVIARGINKRHDVSLGHSGADAAAENSLKAGRLDRYEAEAKI